MIALEWGKVVRVEVLEKVLKDHEKAFKQGVDFVPWLWGWFHMHVYMKTWQTAYATYVQFITCLLHHSKAFKYYIPFKIKKYSCNHLRLKVIENIF